MSSETTSQTHPSLGVTPVSPWRVRCLSVQSQWQLALTFNVGLSGVVDCSQLVLDAEAGIFAALRNADLFARAYLNCGAVAWPNGADIAPHAMYKAIQAGGGRWQVPA